jgi:hypothetical protein
MGIFIYFVCYNLYGIDASKPVQLCSREVVMHDGENAHF